LPALQQSPLIDAPSAQSLNVGYTHVVSNTLVNEVRAGYIRSAAYTQSPAPRPLFEEFGIKGISPFSDLTGLPVFTIAGFGVLGDRRILPERHRVGVLQLTDRLSWVRRAHAVTVGGEVHLKNRQGYSAFLSRAEFVFTGQFTSHVPGVGSGSALADLLLGQTSTATLNNRLDYAFQDSSYALYAQDTWRLSPRLTLNLGLRYELQTPLAERQNRMSNFDLDPESPTFSTLILATDGDLRSRTFRDLETTNLAPRLGFVYQADSSTIVRGAFGTFYGGLGYEGLGGSPAANPLYYIRTAYRSGGDAAISSLVLADGFPQGTLDPNTVRNPVVNALSPKLPLGEVHQWSLGIQRLLFGAGLSLTYIGSRSSHLPGLNAANAPIPGPGPVDPRRPFPTFGDITLTSPSVDASYNALQAQLDRRFSHGFALLSSYTWSHAIDTATDFGDTDGLVSTIEPQNPDKPNAERASASFDVRHRWVTSVIYDLPVGHNGEWLGRSRVARALVGGWQVAGIFVAQSGPPVTATLNRNPANTTTVARPNCVGDGTLPREQRTVERWFDVSVFGLPSPYSYGNCGRNVLRAPGLLNLDLLIARTFQMKSKRRLELRGEFFNATNAVHLGRPNAVIDLPQAGQITSTQAPPRQVQIGLRFVF
jgi:outer membrane receptor protein involved in Fe transport